MKARRSEGQLLRAMRRIVGRVQIDRDPLGLALQALAMPLDHGIGQRHTQNPLIPVSKMSCHHVNGV